MIDLSKFDYPVRFQASYKKPKEFSNGGTVKFIAHLRAYGVYSALYGRSQTAERLAERGGFCPEEFSQFYPEWRNYIIEPQQEKP